LLIAKLDRLARNVHFITGLLEAGVEIKAADMPEADRTFLQMAAVLPNGKGAASASGLKLRWPKRGREAQSWARRTRRRVAP